MQLVRILTAAFLLSSCSSVLGSEDVNPQAEEKVVDGFVEPGLWKRYKVVGEEEEFKLLGSEEYYPYVKDLDVYTKSEITEEALVETYIRGPIKVVTTVSGPYYDQVTVDFGDGNPIKFNANDATDGSVTFDMDGVTHTTKRVYIGPNEFKQTNTVTKGDQTNVSVEYFRKVED